MPDFTKYGGESGDRLPQLWAGFGGQSAIRTTTTEDSESAPKLSKSPTIDRTISWSISVVLSVRFAVPSTVQPRHRPPEHRSLPSSAWPLAGKSLNRRRHERQEGGLARAVKPNACSSRAVVPACLLAVSEGRTLERLEGSTPWAAQLFTGAGEPEEVRGSARFFLALP